MKRFNLAFILLLVVVVTSGCQHGKWRLRGARCRPGMTMPTYAQTGVPVAPPPAAAAAAPCAPGYTTGYPPPGFAPTGYMPGGYMQGGYMPGGYPAGMYNPTEGFISDGTITSGDAVQGIETTPIPVENGTTVERPYIESAPYESSSNVITVPGPEVGPLPSG